MILILPSGIDLDLIMMASNEMKKYLDGKNSPDQPSF